MKIKFTKFKWLAATLLFVTAMVMPKMAWAQNKMYAELSSGTLTFKYGEKPTGGEGITVYNIPDVSSSPDWNLQVSSSIKTVVFDESFKDARPTTCYCWFSFCTSLTTINGIENLNTEDVTDMDNMFYNCSSLSTLDLSGFNTANVRYMGMMFCNCSKLTTIYASSKFTISAGTSSLHMFLECTSLVGAIKYDSSKTDASYANTTNGYFSIKGSETKPKGAYVVYTDADNTLTFKYGEIPTEGEGITVYDIPDASSYPGWISSSITTVVFDDSFKDARPTRCYAWFNNCTSLTTINGIENLNTEDVTDMEYMFRNCSSLTTLDLSGFNTAKVENMNYMFCNCSELTTIYASSNFTTSAVTSSSDDMFSGCTSLAGAIKYDSSKTYANYANYHTGYFSYGINTVDDLKTFANKVNGTYTPATGETATPYTAICAGLMANITLTDANNLPAIGSGGYSGTFDGCGHTISGLNFSSASSALFAQNSGTIKNLGIAEATIAESANGYLCQTNEGTIKNCFFMGTATGSSQGAGGICQTNNGTITNCYYLADSETDAIEGTTYKTTDQFKSGEVAYLLNKGNTDDTQTWYQNLSGNIDSWPVGKNTGSNTVYKVKILCGGTNEIGKTYANTSNDITEEHNYVLSDNPDEKGLYDLGCTKCNYVKENAKVIKDFNKNGENLEVKVENGSYSVDNLTLYDNSEARLYNSPVDLQVNTFSYTRNLTHGNFAPLYVPFAMNYDDWQSQFDVYQFNTFHETKKADGSGYDVTLEVKRVTSGGIEANYPCIILPKSYDAANPTMTITIHDVTLKSKQGNSRTIDGEANTYTFTGVYDETTLGVDNRKDYAMSKGEIRRAAENAKLNPQRWYLTVESASGENDNSASVSKAQLFSVVIGGEGEATGIEDVKVITHPAASRGIHDLTGRRLAKEPAKGIFVKDGKKIIK